MGLDIIGNIAILGEDATKKQAQELIKKHKNIKTVLKKADIHKGKYRTQKLKYLAGIKTKETTYKENNCIFKLDVEKCYFSQRSSNERLRIKNLVKPNEKILIMFSGINPFGAVIAKNTLAREIDAVEVIIRTEDKEIIIENPSVSKVNMGGQATWQIMGNETERSLDSTPEINEDDIKTVMEQTNCSEEEAKDAIEKHEGDLASAIMELQEKKSE